jgi:D-serine deaminase-like pyridoxal phosphate-dependent protein
MNYITSAEPAWFEVEEIDQIPSPALLFYRDRIIENIRRMIAVAETTDHLRPHIKTHKSDEIIRLQMDQGITKFKCSTIAEVEMVANCGAKDILLAFQPVGPNVNRFIKVIQRFKNSKISTIVDSESIIHQISAKAVEADLEIPLWLDVNIGMNRTGIVPGDEAIKLCQLICDLPNIALYGLHVYDGHIHESDPVRRKVLCDEAYEPVHRMIEKLSKSGIQLPAIVAGGTPTFPIHAKRSGTEVSPGTTVLWDYGYSHSFPDMSYLHAALVLTRVVSKPGDDLLCFDLGHKAVGDDMPNPRVHLLGFNSYEFIKHNEEHLVIKTKEAVSWNVGDPCFGIPYHICPTVIRYDAALVVENHRVIDEWKITARDRKITI